jgi:peptide/nickel transport system substrate-binding protein
MSENRRMSGHTPSDEEIDPTGFNRAAFLQKAGLIALGPAAAGLVAARPGRASSVIESLAKVKVGGTMQIATDQMFSGDSLDPVKSINDGQGIAQGLLRQTLTILDKNQNPHPLLANWSANARFTEYTLHLQRGVTFHSGAPFTADDAAWSIKRYIDPKTGSYLVGRIGQSLDPSGVQVVDPGTLKLSLKRSDSLLMGPLSRLLITPANTTNFEDGNGTGPFKLDSWVAGVSCSVSKNPNYWESGLPYLDGVHLIQISEASTKTQSVLSGPSDVTELDYQSLPLIKGKSGVQQILGREYHTVNVALDMTRKPFSDNRVREALKRSIDREKLIKIAYAGYGTPAADTVVPWDDPQFPQALRARTKRDLAKARQLMNDAGYPNGYHFTLPTPSDSLHATFALALAQSVSGSPFTITVQQHPGATFWNKIWLHAPVFVSDWNRRKALDAEAQMLDGPDNEPKFHNARVKQLSAQGFASQGKVQDRAVAEMLTIISKTSGDLIPAYRHRIFLAKSSVKGLTVNPTWIYDFRRVQRA